MKYDKTYLLLFIYTWKYISIMRIKSNVLYKCRMYVFVIACVFGTGNWFTVNLITLSFRKYVARLYRNECILFSNNMTKSWYLNHYHPISIYFVNNENRWAFFLLTQLFNKLYFNWSWSHSSYAVWSKGPGN